MRTTTQPSSSTRASATDSGHSVVSHAVLKRTSSPPSAEATSAPWRGTRRPAVTLPCPPLSSICTIVIDGMGASREGQRLSSKAVATCGNSASMSRRTRAVRKATDSTSRSVCGSRDSPPCKSSRAATFG